MRRLSVDLDLNFVGAPDREAMLKERPMLEPNADASVEDPRAPGRFGYFPVRPACRKARRTIR